ncbi:hypothetical protein ACFOD7_00330 [Paracoccus fontiphilus]|uniref:Uncharacterized protein n=1 Tax=Paracoccus fontiphilus TaxID=1815556 RepID=A0ABV7IAD9_9RHOB
MTLDGDRHLVSVVEDGELSGRFRVDDPALDHAVANLLDEALGIEQVALLRATVRLDSLAGGEIYRFRVFTEH